MTDADLTVRAATDDDYEDVVAFTRNTWPERETGDYLADVFHDWIAKESAKTAVAVDEDAVAGILQCTFLSDREAWLQGMRVDPDHRGRGVGSLLVEHLFDWARSEGATVARNMVFSWNQAGLGQSRATGFEPTTEFRWLEPDPDPAAEGPLDATTDPDAAWQYWQQSAARDHLRGLALAPEESWAVRELTREDFRDAADETAAFGVTDGDGARAATFRVRDYEREVEDGESGASDDAADAATTEHVAEYGVGAWADVPALETLVAAIKRDAAAIGADRTRVLIPETVRHVSDGAAVRAGISDHPDFVLSADLTGR
ncbi:GNAT family N-acetyltransferase [Natronoarchaeum rubrum]|uniref:GNAT family N-acetyltransferase n=1 Tax=Natronoarchaeum rubrum TaxID=755311 RepID=UPI0021117AF6|nr:GNAT family N-acetyltransferase [Natronoarchaeum rubrum]